MMVLENACEFKEYLGSVFDAMGFYGSFEVVGNNIELNIIRYYKLIKSYKEL
ncbi:hypothetical protein [Helicobacter pylori]|uniref:hypothetical protein n=1 Tax=Helicobacter pylori TaxID=210 RepID=UPI001E59EA7B|nr:hypothetical protein [Helicobacter pylori]